MGHNISRQHDSRHRDDTTYDTTYECWISQFFYEESYSLCGGTYVHKGVVNRRLSNTRRLGQEEGARQASEPRANQMGASHKPQVRTVRQDHSREDR
jgi:hypothetical protein